MFKSQTSSKQTLVAAAWVAGHGQKQWDGLLLISSASMCQTEIDVSVNDKEDRLSRWIIDLQSRRHANVVAVALANKMARMAWVMMTRGVDYDPDLAAAPVS